MENYVIEPKQFKVMEFPDDFNAVELKSFDTVYGIIIWCCLKVCHITEQHFDDMISRFVADGHLRNLPDDYFEFRGRLTYDFVAFSKSNLSLWLMIYRLLQNPELFEFKLHGSVYKLNKETMKLFKPENYI